MTSVYMSETESLFSEQSLGIFLFVFDCLDDDESAGECQMMIEQLWCMTWTRTTDHQHHHHQYMSDVCFVFQV